MEFHTWVLHVHYILFKWSNSLPTFSSLILRWLWWPLLPWPFSLGLECTKIQWLMEAFMLVHSSMTFLWTNYKLPSKEKKKERKKEKMKKNLSQWVRWGKLGELKFFCKFNISTQPIIFCKFDGPIQQVGFVLPSLIQMNLYPN